LNLLFYFGTSAIFSDGLFMAIQRIVKVQFGSVRSTVILCRLDVTTIELGVLVEVFTAVKFIRVCLVLIMAQNQIVKDSSYE